jgi:hypothetical protein
MVSIQELISFKAKSKRIRFVNASRMKAQSGRKFLPGIQLRLATAQAEIFAMNVRWDRFIGHCFRVAEERLAARLRVIVPALWIGFPVKEAVHILRFLKAM